jgi:biopolymer transport protein ExbB
MIALGYSVLTFFAQAASPATPAPGATPPGAPPAVDPGLAAAKAEAAAKAAKEAGAQSLNAYDMFIHADIVVKFIMIGLLLCSIYALALLFEKIYVMRTNNSRIKDFLAGFRKANSVEEAEAIVRKLPTSGIKTMYDAGMAEVRKAQDLGLYTMRDARDHTMQRVSSAMTVKENEHLENLGSSMTFLASIGSNAPFIGLFGTVWGIMNSFIGIANTQTTSLAVVAPGIAEALLCTAIGLAAAVPSVLIYNYSAKQISKIGGKMDDFGSEFIALVSRDMDRRAA